MTPDRYREDADELDYDDDGPGVGGLDGIHDRPILPRGFVPTPMPVDHACPGCGMWSMRECRCAHRRQESPS